MKKAVTFHFDAELLEAARRCEIQENRSLTIFVEILVKKRLVPHVDSATPPLTPLAAAAFA